MPENNFQNTIIILAFPVLINPDALLIYYFFSLSFFFLLFCFKIILFKKNQCITHIYLFSVFFSCLFPLLIFLLNTNPCLVIYNLLDHRRQLQYKKDIKLSEIIQRKATKVIKGLERKISETFLKTLCSA